MCFSIYHIDLILQHNTNDQCVTLQIFNVLPSPTDTPKFSQIDNIFLYLILLEFNCIHVILIRIQNLNLKVLLNILNFNFRVLSCILNPSITTIPYNIAKINVVLIALLYANFTCKDALPCTHNQYTMLI